MRKVRDMQIDIYKDGEKIFSKEMTRKRYSVLSFEDEDMVDKLSKVIDSLVARELMLAAYENTDYAMDNDGYEYEEHEIYGETFSVEACIGYEPEEDTSIFEHEDKSDDF